MREKLIELIGATHYGNNSLVGENFQEGFIAKIADNLIANGVEIPVRCKDCKHYKPQNKVPSHHGAVNYCKRVVTLKMPPEGFCCYGERREEQ